MVFSLEKSSSGQREDALNNSILVTQEFLYNKIIWKNFCCIYGITLCVCVCVCFSFVINVKLHYILLSVIACFTLLVDSRSFDKAKWMIFITIDKYS